MFEKKAYYNYIKILETASIMRFGSILLVFIISGYLLGTFVIDNTAVGLILGIVLGVVIYYPSYLKEQIMVEEMKMRIDIYNFLEKK